LKKVFIFSLLFFIISTFSFADLWDDPAFKLYKKAVYFFNQKQYIKAESLLKRSLKIFPDNFLTLFLMGDTLFVQKRYKEAKLFYQKTLKIYPSFLEGYERMAAVEEALGNYYDAKKYYLNIIKRKPNNKEAIKGIIRIGLYQKDLDNTLNIITPLVKNRKDKDILLLYSRLFKNKGKLLAEADVLKRIDNKDNQIKKELGFIYFKLKRWDESEKWFNTLLNKDEEVLFALGIIYYNKKAKDKALLFFKKASSKMKNPARAFYNIAMILIEKEKYKKAREWLLKSVDADPNFKEAYLELGHLEEDIFLNIKKAKFYYSKANKIK